MSSKFTQFHRGIAGGRSSRGVGNLGGARFRSMKEERRSWILFERCLFERRHTRRVRKSGGGERWCTKGGVQHPREETHVEAP